MPRISKLSQGEKQSTLLPKRNIYIKTKNQNQRRRPRRRRSHRRNELFMSFLLEEFSILETRNETRKGNTRNILLYKLGNNKK